MRAPLKRDLERLRYVHGQTLRADDFRRDRQHEAERRRLHHRALHGTSGVSIGLDVSPSAADSRLVEVACGVAYDCDGRMLVVAVPRTLERPDGAHWLVLQARTGAPAACGSDDVALEEAALRWIPLAATVPVRGVVLARTAPTGLDPSWTPQHARRLARPRLARGQTVRGLTTWEPWAVERLDAEGELHREVVGVQSRIDTSAAGFTGTPCYVATLDSPAWDTTKAEFAPAFFPHVAEAAADGFTFRLLLVEMGRRRQRAAFATARVAATSRTAQGQLVVDLAQAGAVRTGDVVAQLRPRARLVSQVRRASGTELSLDAPLAGAESGSSVLAVGNLPRASVVTAIVTDTALVAAFKAAAPVRKGDALLRSADLATAVVSAVTRAALTVDEPFDTWSADDAVMVARQAAAATVKSAALAADGLSLDLVLSPASHAISVGQTVAVFDKQRALAAVGKVTARSGASIVVPAPAGIDVAGARKVAVFSADLSISAVGPRSTGQVVRVQEAAPFAVGDVVGAAHDRSIVALVQRVAASSKQLTLSGVLPLAVGSTLVGANWRAATTVAAFGSGPVEVVVGRTVVTPDSVVARREGDATGEPVAVRAVSGTLVTLAAALPGLARLDTLAIAEFPQTVSVTARLADDRIQIAEVGALRPGDLVSVAAASGARPVVQVSAVAGAEVVLADALGAIAVGQSLVVVEFRDTVQLVAVGTADPTDITVDRAVVRPGDVVGLVSHYVDRSNPGYVERVQGTRATLAFPGLVHGDGIVDMDWIDGGIVGPAVVSHEPPVRSFPVPFQPLVRLETAEGLTTTAAVLHGLDELTGRFASTRVTPIVVDQAARRLLVLPLDARAYRYRPETLSLVTAFNADFPRAFATFAQRQGLAVSWVGCQQAFPPVVACSPPAESDVCDDDARTEDQP